MSESMHDAAARLGVTVEVMRDRGAQIEDSWKHHAYVLRVSFANGKSWAGVPWRQGYWIETSPEDSPAEILNALVSDCFDGSFEDFCGEYGEDEDSRKAYATWEACAATLGTLTDILGADEVERLRYEVEAL